MSEKLSAPVTIASLEVENVKRIKAVQFAPAATGLTVLGGGNNQGKTSVLDAIAWALGGERFRPDGAARDGALAPPHLRVQLSNGLVVERRGKNSALTVTDPTGRRGGQQILNEFVEQLALDLPRFMESSDREKADILLRIIGVGDQLHMLDAQIKSLYDKRTAVGQIADQKKAHADSLEEYPDAPAELVSAADLIRRQQDILARNAENQRLRGERDRLRDRACRLKERMDALQEQLRELHDSYLETMQELEIAEHQADGLQEEPTAALEAALSDVEETNRKVRANLEKSRAADDADVYRRQYDEMTARLTNLRQRRTDLLNGANLPLAGLGVEDGRLTYNGHTWRDMSGSEQLRVATAIVRRLNPRCGFVLLDKLEQMDLQTLAEFGVWLREQGLQAIATRVSTGGECQIIIEDGQVQTKPAQWQKGVF